MMSGAFSAGYFSVIVVLLLSTLLNAFYLLPIVYVAFFEQEKRKRKPDICFDHGEAPFFVVLALMVTAVMCFLLFIYPDIFLVLAEQLV